MGRTLDAFCLAVVCAAAGCGQATGEDPGELGSAGETADAPAAAPVRFIALGDTGQASDVQYQVAGAMRDHCAVEGCDFVVLLGDNIYPDGVKKVGDPEWQSAFEEPYADLDLPFYAVLGNHDYGGKVWFVDADGYGNQFERGPVQVAYSQQSDKWRMPATHYTMRHGPVGFIGLDSNSIVWDNDEHGDQWSWFPGALAEVADAPWVFALGHHPFRSNGPHGNAGDYELLLDISVPVDQLDGEEFEEFMAELVCGNVDAYLAGHDHQLQWLDPSLCAGTELVVSGAGGELKDLDDPERNPAFYQVGETAGFFYVVADEESFTGRFIDASGAVLYQRTVSK